MISNLVLYEVLKNLKVVQIDGLRQRNRHLKNFISSKRCKLPCTPVHQVEIYQEVEGKCRLVCYKDKKWFRINANTDELMEYLTHLKPKIVRMKGDYVTQDADSEWFKNINYLSAQDITDEQHFSNLIRKLRCSSLNFASLNILVYADEMLHAMPYVKDFMVRCSEHSGNFFTDLAEKTKLGPGLDSFIFSNFDGFPINVDHFMYFLGNAKFSNNLDVSSYNILIDIYYINCSIEEFILKLAELAKLQGLTTIFVIKYLFYCINVYNVTLFTSIFIDLFVFVILLETCSVYFILNDVFAKIELIAQLLHIAFLLSLLGVF